jgi:hypothetical protein
MWQRDSKSTPTNHFLVVYKHVRAFSSRGHQLTANLKRLESYGLLES